MDNGYVILWKYEKVKKEFPNCDKLFSHIPTSAVSDLEGIKYFRVYEGDNVAALWYSPSCWSTYVFDVTKSECAMDSNLVDELIDFVEFLKNNYCAKWMVC